MSVTIAIPTALRQLVDGQAQIEVEATNAGEALDRLASLYAELRRHLLTIATRCAALSTST